MTIMNVWDHHDGIYHRDNCITKISSLTSQRDHGEQAR